MLGRYCTAGLAFVSLPSLLDSQTDGLPVIRVGPVRAVAISSASQRLAIFGELKDLQNPVDIETDRRGWPFRTT
jgi:hypothetical protein